MEKKSLIIVLLIFITGLNAQKSQRVGYIDMEYILQHIPEYKEAQKSLDSKVVKWKSELDKKTREIETMKSDLGNEKPILTKELIAEREEDITIKQDELAELENSYFGANGKMYTIRKQLVQPVQDHVYNAVQTIAARKKYDFVFDKSSDLVMLYANKKHDISELVVKLIKIDQKKEARANKVSERKKLLQSDDKKEREAQRQKRAKAREDKAKQMVERRKKITEAREKKRKLLQEKKEALRKKREEAKKKKAQAN